MRKLAAMKKVIAVAVAVTIVLIGAGIFKSVTWNNHSEPTAAVWPQDWAGSAFCHSQDNGSPIGGFRGVEACSGPLQGTIQGMGTTFDTAGWQCVEYAERYFYYITGLKGSGFPVNPIYRSAGGRGFAADVSREYPQFKIYPSVANVGTSTYNSSLQPGAILSMWYKGSTFGHVAIVEQISINSSGTGTIKVSNENANRQSNVSIITVANWQMSYADIEDESYNLFQWVYGSPITSGSVQPSTEVQGSTSVKAGQPQGNRSSKSPVVTKKRPGQPITITTSTTQAPTQSNPPSNNVGLNQLQNSGQPITITTSTTQAPTVQISQVSADLNGLVTVKGSGFGPQPTYQPGPGGAQAQFAGDTSEVTVRDLTQGWSAGCLGCGITLSQKYWTSTQLSFGMGTAGFGGGWRFHPGDQIELDLNIGGAKATGRTAVPNGTVLSTRVEAVSPRLGGVQGSGWLSSPTGGVINHSWYCPTTTGQATCWTKYFNPESENTPRVGGNYTVRVWVPVGDANANVSYKIVHAGNASYASVQQANVSGWIDLGTYWFGDNHQGYVGLTSQSSQTGLVVGVDRIDFVYQGQ